MFDLKLVRLDVELALVDLGIEVFELTSSFSEICLWRSSSCLHSVRRKKKQITTDSLLDLVHNHYVSRQDCLISCCMDIVREVVYVIR